MQKWEYNLLVQSPNTECARCEEALNGLGRDGWELVTFYVNGGERRHLMGTERFQRQTACWRPLHCLREQRCDPSASRLGRQSCPLPAVPDQQCRLNAGIDRQVMPPFVASRMTAQRLPRRRSQRDGDKPCSSPSSRRTTGCIQPPAKG